MSDTTLQLRIAIAAQTEKITEVQKALGQLGGSVDGAGKKIGDVDIALSTFAKGFAVSKVVDGIASITSSFSAAMDSVNEFKHKMAEVSTLSSATTEQIKKLSSGVANLSVPFSNLQIGEALYQAQSAGVEFGKSLQFVEKSSKLAVAGNADLRASTDLLTNVMNSYSLSADQAGRVSDAAMAAVKGGKTTIREMGADIGKLAAGFASAGISIEDMFAMMATVTSGGIGTAETITYLSSAIQNVTKPSEEAKKVAKQLGIEFNFQALQAKGAVPFFKELSAVTSQYTNQAEIVSKLFGDEAGRGVNQMLRGNAEALEKMAEAQQNNTNATDEAAAKMDTAKNAGLKLQKSLEGVAFALKDGLDNSSAIEAVANAISSATPLVYDFQSAFQSVVPALESVYDLNTDIASAAGAMMSVFVSQDASRTLTFGQTLAASIMGVTTVVDGIASAARILFRQLQEGFYQIQVWGLEAVRLFQNPALSFTDAGKKRQEAELAETNRALTEAKRNLYSAEQSGAQIRADFLQRVENTGQKLNSMYAKNIKTDAFAAFEMVEKGQLQGKAAQQAAMTGLTEKYKQAIENAKGDTVKMEAVATAYSKAFDKIKNADEDIAKQPAASSVKTGKKALDMSATKDAEKAINDAKKLLEEWNKQKIKMATETAEAENDELVRPYIKLTAEYEGDLKRFGSVKARKEEIEKAYAKKLAALNKVTRSKALDEEIKQEADAYSSKENFQASIEQGLLSEAATIKKVYEYRKSAIELTTSGVEKERKLEELRHEEALFNLKEELRQKKLDPTQYQTAMALENERYRQSANNLTGYTKQAFDTLQGALQAGFFDVMTGKFKNLGDTFRNIFLNAGTSVAQSLSKSMSESVTDYAKQLITGQTPTTAEALLSTVSSFGTVDPQSYGDIANMAGSKVDGTLITTLGGSIVDTATGKVTVQGSDIASLPIAPSASGANSIQTALGYADKLKNAYNLINGGVTSSFASMGGSAYTGLTSLGVGAQTASSVASGISGVGVGITNPFTATGGLSQIGATGTAGQYGMLAGQSMVGAGIGYAVGTLGDKLFGAKTQAANFGAMGGAIGTAILPGIGTAVGVALGSIVGGAMGSTKVTGQGIDIFSASAASVKGENYKESEYKSWFNSSKKRETFAFSDGDTKAIQQAFKTYDYILAELDSAQKLIVGKSSYSSIQEFLDEGITKAFISATGSVDTEAVYTLWSDYAKSINKTISEAFGEQIGQFVTEKRAFTEWSLGFNGKTTEALKFKADYLAKDFAKLEENMGATGVTAENFAEKMDKSVKESLTPENIKNWSSLSAALKASEEAQKAYKNAIKETTKTVQNLIDSISNLSANTAVAYTMSARNLRSAKEEFATAFNVVAPGDISNLREYMRNLDISSLTDSQASSLQTLTSAYATIDQAQKAYTATLQQTANTVNGMVESVLYRNATPDTKLALAKVNYQVVWKEEANANNTTEWYNLLRQKQAGLEEGTTFNDFQTKTLNDLGAALASVEDAATQAATAATQTATALAETAKAEIERRKSLIADLDAYIEQIGYRHATVEEKLALASVQFHASTGNITPESVKDWMDYGEALKGANPTDANVEAWKKLGQTLADAQDLLLNKAKEVEAAWKSATTDIEAAIKALNPTIRAMSELKGESVTLDNYKELLNALESSRQEELKRAQEATDARLKSLEDEKRLIIDIQRIVQTMTERIIDVQVANNVSYKAELSKVTAAMQTSFNVDLTNVTSAANNYLNKYQEESTSRLDYIRQVASVRADFSSLTGQTHGTIESVERAIKEAQAALEYRLGEINNTAKSILHDWLVQAQAAQAQATNHTQMILNQIAAVQQEIFNKNLSVTVNPTPVVVTVTGEGYFGGASGGGGFTVGGGGSGTVTAPTIIPTVTPVAPSVPTNEFYNAIDAAYRTVLGRGVTDNNDITGLPYWTSALQSGSVSLADLVKSVAIGSVPEMYQDLQLSLTSWAHDFWKSEVLTGVVAPQSLRGATSYAKQVSEAYQTVLGRAPDQSGFSFWTDALVRGVQDPSTLKRDLWRAAQAAKEPTLSATEPTLFAQGGIVTKATNAIIGEAGYPEAVIPLKDGAGLKVDVGGVTAELRAMREEIRELKEVVIEVLAQNQKLVSLIDRLSEGGEALNIRDIAA